MRKDNNRMRQKDAMQEIRITTLEQKLADANEAYTKGAFNYLRLLVHVLGTSQFVYGIYYYWFYVHWPEHMRDDFEEKSRWGGPFKYLTFLDLLIQAVYHFVALLNDLFGSNAVTMEKKSQSLFRRIKDFSFCTWAFPIATNVSLSFWVIYAYDRELILPAVLDEIFPKWLNHIVHTNVAMLGILDLFTCFRQYPSRSMGVTCTSIFMVIYIIWLHVVYYFSGQWVYNILNVLNLPMRYLMLSALVGFNAFCYLLGEFINNVIWAQEIKWIKEIKKPKTK